MSNMTNWVNKMYTPIFGSGYSYNIDFERPNYPLPWNLEIKKVIFNGPATIVLWTDGTKTVVKCTDSEVFDFEKGVAMAIWKKFLPMQYGRKAKRIISNARKQGDRSCFYCKHFDSLSCIGCVNMSHYEER